MSILPLELRRTDPIQTSEWLECLEQLIEVDGTAYASQLLERLLQRAAEMGVPLRHNTAYRNTIPPEREFPFPGDLALERRIENLIRYNALAMVARANKYDENIGGHMASYASVATLFEVGFNHFFRGSIGDQPGDMVYFQGHSSPGIYARAFLEGRLSESQLANFRHELRSEPGLSSYPHPWLMPDFWQFPTVSMGLGPINAIYQARFLRYLENRGITKPSTRKVWAFLGDGEMDEPESRGALTVASREHLDNLIFVVNCNLQRLDGPVRGNGKIIQELEASFLGAGWNVIKCICGSNWDALFARDTEGWLVKRMAECVDGEFQAFKARDGAYVREHFFGRYPQLLKLVESMPDQELADLTRGGHDPAKVYNAYRQALQTEGVPTVVLAKTVKGYGLGDAAEGRNFAHNAKKLKEEQLRYVVRRFAMNVPEEKIGKLELYHPGAKSLEIQYMKQRRETLGGALPSRKIDDNPLLIAPPLETFSEVLKGSNGRAVSTTSGLNAVLSMLIKHKELSRYIVPIIPDEGRTFGMESLFRSIGIYASGGQIYTPVDSDQFLYYREAKDGQLIQEGITEAGSMATFTAAGTAYANLGIPTIPFFVFYSMFGFQRVGDLIWAFADARGKGFMVGGTAGRTTLLGEGLQHMDGHSHVLASTVPTCRSYDPAYAYEIAVIVQDGLRCMYQQREDCFYYFTVYNENYPQPAMPQGVQEGIVRGLYRFRAAQGTPVIHLFGSGPILNEALKAQEILAEKYNVTADVWSVTSYVELRRDALACERWNRLHPGETPRIPFLLQALNESKAPIVAASDYLKIMADGLAPWLPGQVVALGTDGFGCSDNREHLRRHFEVDAVGIASAALSRLAQDGTVAPETAQLAIAQLGIDPNQQDAALS